MFKFAALNALALAVAGQFTNCQDCGANACVANPHGAIKHGASHGECARCANVDPARALTGPNPWPCAYGNLCMCAGAPAVHPAPVMPVPAVPDQKKPSGPIPPVHHRTQPADFSNCQSCNHDQLCVANPYGSKMHGATDVACAACRNVNSAHAMNGQVPWPCAYGNMCMCH
jgi:hypothetical protein